MLHEVNVSNLADTSRASNQLQRRSLGWLSPGFVEAPSKRRTQQPSKKSEEKATKRIDSNTNVKVPTNEPARRIRRPTMIRRPKLIGKSVEGAAMQAMAASRKRASTNQFKSKTNPTATGAKAPMRSQPNREPGRFRSNVGTESNLARSEPRTHRVQTEQKDENLTHVLNDFSSLCSRTHGQLTRLNSAEAKARLQLADVWWPQIPSQTIPKSVAEFLISKAPNAWNDVSALPPLPSGVLDIFIPTLARWIVALTPGLELLSVSSSSSNNGNNKIDSLLLSTEIRNVHGTKCCAILRISLIKFQSSKHRIPIVRSEGWILNLRRRPKDSKASKKVKRYTNMRSSHVMEKDSAGMDKVLVDIHVSFNCINFFRNTLNLTFFPC